MEWWNLGMVDLKKTKLKAHTQSFSIPLFHAAYQDIVCKKHRDSLRGVGFTKRGLYEPEANKL